MPKIVRSVNVVRCDFTDLSHQIVNDNGCNDNNYNKLLNVASGAAQFVSYVTYCYTCNIVLSKILLSNAVHYFCWYWSYYVCVSLRRWQTEAQRYLSPLAMSCVKIVKFVRRQSTILTSPFRSYTPLSSTVSNFLLSTCDTESVNKIDYTVCL